VNKTEVYKEICDEIEKRCKFLLLILASENTNQSATSDDGVQAEKTSTGHKRGHSIDQTTTINTNDKKATAALMVWHATKEFVSLKDASSEERYGIIWKLVLSFLDEKKIDTEILIKKINQDRWLNANHF